MYAQSVEESAICQECCETARRRPNTRTGSALPATLQGTVALESEVLSLRSGDVAIADRVTRNLTASDPQQEIQTRVEGTWQLDGDRLVVTFPTRRLQFRVEAAGLELRLRESESVGGAVGQPDVFYEQPYRREPI